MTEDQAVVREGLRILLEAQGDIRVVGKRETGRQAVELTKNRHPGAVVMDIAMPLLKHASARDQIRHGVNTP